MPLLKFGMWVESHLLSVFTALAAAISAVWFAVLLQMQLHRYHTMFFTSDLAYYCNMLYNTGWGHFLYSDFDYLFNGFSTYLSNHFSPSLGLLAPVYRVLPSPATLLVIQVFAVATAGWLLAQIGKMLVCRNALLSKWTLIVPLLAQGLYLFNQSTIEATMDSTYGFHHDCLIPLFLLATVFFYLAFTSCAQADKKRRAGYLVCAAVCFFLLLGVKETVPLVAIAFLVPVLLFDRHTDKKLMLWALGCCGIMIMGSLLFQYMVKTNQRNLEAISDFLSLDTWASKFGYLYYISAWRILLCFIPLILVPQAYAPFLAEFSLQLIIDTSPFDWHAFPIVAVSALAAMAGTIILLSRLYAWRLPAKIFAALTIAAYMVLLYVPAVRAGCNEMAFLHRKIFSQSEKIPLSDIKTMARLVPSDAKLAATTDLLLFFANRPHLRWPDQLKDIDMILTSNAAGYKADTDLHKVVRKLENNGAILQIKQAGVLHLYQRNPAGPPVVYEEPDYQKKEIENLKQAIRTRPNDAEAYYNLGVIYGKLERYNEAIDALKQAIRFRPNDANACYYLGIAYDELAGNSAAIKTYKRAIRIRPSFVEAYCNLGVAYCKLGRYDEAVEAEKQAIRIKPDYVKAYFNLGVICGRFEHYDKAIDAFRQAIRIKPDYAMAYCNLGAAYNEIGQFNDAITALKQAVRIDPDNAQARSRLGKIYIAVGDSDSALNEYKILKDLDKNLADELLNLPGK